MRFLFIHQNFPGQFEHAAAALAARGHEVVALAVNRRAAPVPGVKRLLYRPAPLPAASAGHPLRAALDEWHAKIARGHAAAQAMRRLQAQGFRPDVVAAHPGWGEALFAKDVFPAARLLVYAEYFYGEPGGDTDFDPEFPAASPELAAQLLRLKNTHLLHALNSCDAAVSPTVFQRNRHPAWARERIRHIHDGIDTERFRPDPQARVHLPAAGLTLRPGDEVVTFVARQLEPYRGYHVLMRALPLLQQLRPQARVVIVGGDGTSYGAPPPAGTTWRKRFLAEVRPQLDLQRIHFVGRLPHGTLTQLMQVSAVHAYLTYPFVLSWSLLEAMSIGCLVVGSDTAPLREVVQDGRNGMLVDFFDHQQLARRVADALERRDELRSMREAARQGIVERFDLHGHCLPQWLALMETLADQQAKPQHGFTAGGQSV